MIRRLRAKYVIFCSRKYVLIKSRNCRLIECAISKKSGSVLYDSRKSFLLEHFLIPFFPMFKCIFIKHHKTEISIFWFFELLWKLYCHVAKLFLFTCWWEKFLYVFVNYTFFIWLSFTLPIHLHMPLFYVEEKDYRRFHAIKTKMQQTKMLNKLFHFKYKIDNSAPYIRYSYSLLWSAFSYNLKKNMKSFVAHLFSCISCDCNASTEKRLPVKTVALLPCKQADVLFTLVLFWVMKALKIILSLYFNNK